MGISLFRRSIGGSTLLALLVASCSSDPGDPGVQQVHVSFNCRSDIATGTTGQRSVVCADFTGDGIADLLVAASAERSLVLLVAATPGGSFSAQLAQACPGEPGELVAGDFDGDGDLDVACRFEAERVVRLFANDGHGRFSGGQAELAGGPRTGLLATDFDGDGRSDLALVATDGREVRVHRALPHGGFDAGLVLTDDPRCDFAALGAGDWNGDGRPDLAAGDHQLARVVVWYQGAAGFDPARRQLLANPGHGATGLCAADLDGDGRPDLAVANQGSASVVVWRGDGVGNFLPPRESAIDGDPFVLSSGDLLATGRPQLVVGFLDRPEVGVLALDASGVVVEERHYAAPGVVLSTAVADLDADGGLDVVAAGTGTALGWLRGGAARGLTAAESFASGGTTASGMLLHDWNGDGRADALVADRHVARCTVLAGTGDGRLVPAATVVVGIAPTRLAGGDFDGDGRLDALLAEASGVRLLLDRTLGSRIAFQVVPPAEAPAIDCGTGPLVLAAWRAPARGADVAAALATGSGSLSVLRHEAAQLVVSDRLEAGAAASDVVAGRFDGAGSAGLAVLRPEAGTILLLRSDVSGSLSPLRELGVAGLRSGLVAADLDGDGRDELIGSTADGIFVRGTQAGQELAAVLATGTPVLALAAGDLNGDRRADLVATLVGRADLLLLVGDGRGGFGALSHLPAWPNVETLGLCDYDGDGWRDLLLAGAAGGRLGVLHNRSRSASTSGAGPAN